MPPRNRCSRSYPRPTGRPARLGALAALAASAGLLTAAVPAAAAAPSGLLHVGSRGPAVARVQRALHFGVTGRYSQVTARAVRTFQRTNGLMVDGIVGPQTWDVLFGITPPPAPAPSTSSTTSSAAPATTASSSATGGYTIPSGIVQCESGGSYSAVNPQSGAGGAYQILPSTWQAYGGQGLPQDAPKAEQDQIAAQIYAHQGASAWSC